MYVELKSFKNTFNVTNGFFILGFFLFVSFNQNVYYITEYDEPRIANKIIVPLTLLMRGLLF